MPFLTKAIRYSMPGYRDDEREKNVLPTCLKVCLIIERMISNYYPFFNQSKIV